jgi:hypothetical protein
VHHGLAVITTRRNVEKSDFVGTFSVVAPSHINRIARIANIDKLHTLDHPPRIYIKARDNSFSQAHSLSGLFSGF